MKYTFIFILIVLFNIQSIAQTVVDQKGTKISVDTSKWKTVGNDIYNKNVGKVGIGTASPSAQLHTTGTVRLEGIGTNTSNTKILTTDASGNVTTRQASELLSGNIRSVAVLGADLSTSSVTSLVDIPDLSFIVTAGITYRFYATIPFTSSDQTNGSRWTINGPATSFLSYTSRYTFSSNSETYNYSNTYNFPNSANNNSNAAGGNLAIIQGMITPSANGTVTVRFASELEPPNSITAKKGATLEFW
jgi:hypothetical protein